MTVSALIDWLDDRINPIVVKELRQAVKSRMVVTILMLFLGIQLFILGAFLFVREGQRGEDVDWSAGAGIFLFQQIILLWTIGLVIPGYAAVRMLAERSDQNVDLMFISTLRPSSIIWGKFFATFMLGMLVFSTCAPFMTFTYLLRGIDIPTILICLFLDLMILCGGTMIALFISSLPGTLVIKVILCLISLPQLIWINAMLSGLSFVLVEDVGIMDFFFENWPLGLTLVAGIFSLIGLLYVYSVAIISPHSSNRMVRIRVYLVGLCLITLGGAIISSANLVGGNEASPIIVFMMCIMPFLFLQIWISICEHERWGPRVARKIPRRGWLRPFAFLFFTGSAGGILFSLGLICVCLVVCCLWLVRITGDVEAAWRIVFVHALAAGYAFCYGLSAVLVRRYVMSNQIKPAFTWVIAALLVGLGTTMPPLFAYFAFPDHMRYRNDMGWWMLPNPFVGYMDALWSWGRRDLLDDYEIKCVWFLITWAAILIVLSLRWFADQIAAFKPPKVKQVEEPVDAIILEPVPSMGAQR